MRSFLIYSINGKVKKIKISKIIIDEIIYTSQRLNVLIHFTKREKQPHIVLSTINQKINDSNKSDLSYI